VSLASPLVSDLWRQKLEIRGRPTYSRSEYGCWHNRPASFDTSELDLATTVLYLPLRTSAKRDAQCRLSQYTDPLACVMF
jgi:hypothetical protein